jgi:23S rRNA pseudouridine2605 synthase
VKERLQKVLARAGYGSRRAAEALIAEGRVRVNGAAVTTPGVQADPAVDVVEVDGVVVRDAAPHVYLAMHKPAGYTTTASDPHAARTVRELLPAGTAAAVQPVGRLDRDTEGLLVFTNDGELAHRLAHPRYEIAKEYHALVRGTPPGGALAALRQGVLVDGKRTAADDVAVVEAPAGYQAQRGYAWVRLVVHEGRKRQVRRMFDAVGHPVQKLVRTRIGMLVLGPLPPAAVRPLSAQELAWLRHHLALVPSPD